jgi:hypothetical protein
VLFLVFEFEPGFVFFQEGFEIFRGGEQAGPLLVVKSDRKAAKSVDAHAAFFGNAKFKIAAALARSLFFLLDPCFSSSAIRAFSSSIDGSAMVFLPEAMENYLINFC